MLLAFYDFPAEHWKHIRTTNPIESTFATVRLRTTKTKGCLSSEAETGSTLLGQRMTKPSSLRVKSSNVNRPETAPFGGRAGATRLMFCSRVRAMLSLEP